MNFPTRELIEYCNNRPDVETENIETVDGMIYKSKLNITKQISPVLLAMHDEIDRLKTSHDFWKSTGIKLDGKYQNWIE